MAQQKDYGIGRLKGTKLWQLRAKHGKDKIFADGDLLLAHAEAYFKWCDTHPRYRAELVKYKGGYEEAEVPLGRPYTMDGLTVYLGVSGAYFRTAKAALREKDENGTISASEVRLLEVFDIIEHTVRNEQIEGAAVGQYKEGLIARLNGIADNVNQNNTGSTVVRVTVRDKETAENLDLLNDTINT